MNLDEDAMVAAVKLIGHTGATAFEFGYEREDAPIEEAGWWAQAYYKGARVIEEQHRDPVAAAEALARRLLTGDVCTHCGGLTTLSDEGVTALIGATMLDGSVMTEERARAAGQCRYRRMGDRWVRGCEQQPRGPGGPSRRERRAAERAAARGMRRRRG